MNRRHVPVLALAPLLALSVVAHARLGEPTVAPQTSAGPAVTKQPLPKLVEPKYKLKVQIVRTADDDGGRASTLTRAAAEQAIARANAVYRRNGGDVQFELHPASNFDSLIKSTALNRDCILAPGQSEATLADNTDGDVNNDFLVGTDADRDMLCNYTASRNARTAYAVQRADRIIVYSRGGNDSLKWDKKAGRWVFGHPSGGASSANGFYVRMPKSFGDDTLLAHEIGHYMHAAHTFGPNPETVVEARTLMEDWAKDHPGADPRAVFDSDSRVQYAVLDTPPDPRKSLLIAVHGGDGCDPDPAKGRVTIAAKVDGKYKSYTLEPDRANVMSYFKGCAGFDHHMSKGQYQQIHAALTTGNRKALLRDDTAGCYTKGSALGTPATTEKQLTEVVRKVTRCLLKAYYPLPWEPVTEQIYRKPAEPWPGFVKQGKLAVDPLREAEMLQTIVDAEREED
jgi:hypothetical protein